MQCPVVLVPNGSKLLCNFLVHISSFLPGASALAPGAGLGKKGPLNQKEKEGVSAVSMSMVLIAARSEDILGWHFGYQIAVYSGSRLGN